VIKEICPRRDNLCKVLHRDCVNQNSAATNSADTDTECERHGGRRVTWCDKVRKLYGAVHLEAATFDQAPNRVVKNAEVTLTLI
jgi:hypothetical protein